ncbi:MAG: aminotransferase class V-fold PLP-dependent enzyme [Alphaproteobacteria bacterium]
MPIDIDRVRADTPGCAHVAHFNNAGAALPPAPVTAAMVDHLRLEAEIGGYEAAARANDAVEHAYDAVARLLNCRRDEVAIVENATRGWDMAFYALGFEAGDRILTATAEYASNYIAFLQIARRTGAVVEAIPDDADGRLDVAALEAAIDDRVRLIAVTHVPTNGGLINPAAEIGRVARAAGIPFLLDACQSAGQLPLDVAAIGCDMLSATGRKYLRGPRGVGFLYVRRDWIERLEPPFLDLHAAQWTGPDTYEVRPDARRFENWEGNVAGKIGLGVAVDYALALGLEAIRERADRLAGRLRRRLADLPGVALCDKGRDKAAIVGFTKAGAAAVDIVARLAARRINVSVSDAPMTYLDMAARGLDEVVRASPHYYNTEAEIDRLIAALAG